LGGGGGKRVLKIFSGRPSIINLNVTPFSDDIKLRLNVKGI